jgi:hypothetical protein
MQGCCLCGRARYLCQQAPIWSVNCHCCACQKLSGAPYVSAFSVPADSFEMIGDRTTFIRSSASGHLVTTTHCAACGTRIFAQSARASHLVNVFASTLIDSSTFVPISNVYLSEAVEWADPPKARFNFSKMPEI